MRSNPGEYGAIIVLGCRVGPDGRACGALRRRALRAAQAMHDGLARRVVVSGGRRWNGVSEADALAEALIAQGVPEQNIVQEGQSCSTRENAAYCRRLLADETSRVLLVTCDFHVTRALRLFGQQGFDCIALPAIGPQRPRLRKLALQTRESVAPLFQTRLFCERPKQ